jgi:hypothetical protein
LGGHESSEAERAGEESGVSEEEADEVGEMDGGSGDGALERRVRNWDLRPTVFLGSSSRRKVSG